VRLSVDGSPALSQCDLLMDKNQQTDLAGQRGRVRLAAASDAVLPTIDAKANCFKTVVPEFRATVPRTTLLPRPAAPGLPGLQLQPPHGRAAAPAEEEGGGFVWEDSRRRVRSRRFDDNEAREANFVQTLLPSMIDGYILSAGDGSSSAAACVLEGGGAQR